MDEKEVMLNAFSKYFNKTDEELTEMLYDKGEDDVLTLKDGVADLLITMDANRITKIKTDASSETTKKFDDGYKKAQKETMSKLEAQIKEQYGLESDKTGLDLITELAIKFENTTDLTEETIKTNPLFLKLEKEWNASVESRIETIQGEFDTFKSGVERNGQLSGIKRVAKQHLLALDPVLSEDAVKSENRVQEFLNKLEGHDYIVDGETIMIKSGDGRLEDAHGNPVGFDAFIKSEAEKTFDFNVQGRKDSPGNTTPSGGGSAITMTKEEYGIAVSEAEKLGTKEGWDRLANVNVV